MKTAKYLFYLNNLIAIAAFMPAVLCGGFTVESWFKVPSGGSDSWDFGYSDEDRIFFTACSVLLLLFYRYVFFNPFLFSRHGINRKTVFTYLFWNVIINALTASLFIYLTGESFFTIKHEGSWWITLILWLPFLPLLFGITGLIELKEKESGINNETLKRNNHE